jgi:DNA-3-methyladenine glycosylase II
MPRISIAAATAEVTARDPALAALADLVGPFRLRPRDPDGSFGSLVHAIAYQQLAGAAAGAIHRRFRALIDGPLTPEAVLALGSDALRGVGLSAAKTASILDLSHKVATGEVDLDGRARRDDEEIISSLVTVRGIGRWTAQMYLLFELGRLDVWPIDDLGVRNGYRVAWGLETPPTPKELGEIGERFRPYRSVVAWYCWQALHLHRAGIAVGNSTWSPLD